LTILMLKSLPDYYFNITDFTDFFKMDFTD